MFDRKSKIEEAATLQNPLFDEKQTAVFLSTTPGTLQVWRCTRRVNLPYIKIGRSVRYRLSDLEKFLESRTVGAIDQ